MEYRIGYTSMVCSYPGGGASIARYMQDREDKNTLVSCYKQKQSIL